MIYLLIGGGLLSFLGGIWFAAKRHFEPDTIPNWDTDQRRAMLVEHERHERRLEE